jgi:hypothetical protein
MNQWGATQADLARVMAGDSLLADPTYSGTMAVIVNLSSGEASRPPSDVVPGGCRGVTPVSANAFQ